MTLAPATPSTKLIEQENQFGAHNYHPLDVVCTKGSGGDIPSLIRCCRTDSKTVASSHERRELVFCNLHALHDFDFHILKIGLSTRK